MGSPHEGDTNRNSGYCVALPMKEYLAALIPLGVLWFGFLAAFALFLAAVSALA